MKMTNKNRGFTLIEVMVALLVLALGILGISKLQGTLIRNSSDANQRSVAMTLAQKKVDDLKSFVHLDDDIDNDPATTETWDPTDPLDEQSYAFIDDNAGGTIASGNITIGNYNYTLTWDMDHWYYASVGSTAVSTSAATIDAKSQFKKVAVTVAWNDQTGTPQSVVLETVIDAYAPDLTALSDNSHDGGDLPRARYTPELAPDVIDITVDTGDGVKRQTSKPLPDAVSTGSNSNILVSFEVISYHQDGSEFIRDRQEEFVTVDCHCNLSAANAVAFPPGHVLWNETDNDRHDFVDFPISKASGSETNNANAVDEICDTCCRDHHDDTASLVKYVDGTGTGDHPHYRASGALATTPGHEYIESCRFKRIDGVLRVFQDWDLKDLTTMNRNNLVDGDPLQAQYISYVEQLLKDEIEGTTLAVQPVLRTPVSSAVGTIQQLESRGVYIDKVYDTTGTLSSEYASYVVNSANADRLERVPFSEVNLTLLSQWNSASTADVSVRNDAIATVSDPVNDYYGTYSRGLITAHAAVVLPGVNITSSMEPSNDGITQLAVNPSPTTPVSDTVAVIVAATATNITVTGDISLISSDSSNINGVKPNLDTAECAFDQASAGPFTCSFPSGSNVSISISASKNNGCSGVGTFSQNNVISDISTGVIVIDCTS